MPFLSRQTPAGERIEMSLLPAWPSRHRPVPGIDTRWIPFGSGTMALAAALSFSARNLPDSAQAILPAYSCPDIVAATSFAGMPIQFLDLAPDLTAPKNADIADTLTRSAGAVVCVDLFGTDCDIAPVRTAADAIGAWIIHDRAQTLGGPGVECDSEADLVIASLGRGKPATLLAGGAAWALRSEEFAEFATREFAESGWNPRAAAIRSVAYNLAITPAAYGLIARLPFLRLGETRLRKIDHVHRFPLNWQRCAALQIALQYSHVNERRDRTVSLSDNIAGAGFRIPDDALASAARVGLNRLPVLCRDEAQAGWIVSHGTHLGLSAMYGRTLPEFLGMPADCAEEAFPNAYRFSRTVVTVPTHSRIDLAIEREIMDIFRNAP